MRAKAISSLVLTLALFFTALQANAANPPKPGAACSKASLTQIHKGKKYTCIKSGKKLVWNKGVNIATKQPTPTPSPTPTPTQIKDLSLSDAITLPSNLADFSICKTADLTNRPDVSNGFPRPSTALNGKANVRILFVPISFTDFVFTDADLIRNKSVTDEVRDFYTKTSYGNVSISFEFLEKKYWVDMSRSAASYNLIENRPQQNNIQVVVDALSLVDSTINFDLYDGVVVETTRFQSTGGGQGFPGQTFKTKTGQARGVSLEFGTGVASFNTLAHELGHSLFGLEDLYVFLNSNRPSVPDPTPAGSCDIMSNSSREYFGWSKMLNGWLLPSQIRCLTNQESTTHYIEDIALSSNKPKLILINLKLGVTLAVETRSIGVVGGALVYKIDSRTDHGDGPIVAQKSLLTTGSELSVDGWRISVIDQDLNGLLVRVSRT